jgi:Trk K+ transport system NAD-binding subunit
MVLGIERGKKRILIPNMEEKMKEGDRVVVYGHLNELKSFFSED